MDADAEAVAKQELSQNLGFLDEHDRQRAKPALRVDRSLKDLARARGVGFIRLETFRDELRRKEQANG
jgi:hypothetical protein